MSFLSTMKLPLILTLGFIIGGCSDPSVVGGKTDKLGIQQSQDQPVLAQIDQQNLSQKDLPLADQIKLYNIEHQLFQLTSASLREQIETEFEKTSGLNWQLRSPIAPVSNIDLKPNWQIGSSDSTWQIDILCNYQSRPCSDILLGIETIRPHLKSSFNLRFFHYWQHYHKHAPAIAAAMECLNEQEKQSVHQALLAKQGQADMEALTQAIDLYSNNSEQTYQCMQQDEVMQGLKTQHDYLSNLGLGKAPTVLLNSQYLARGYELTQFFNAVANDIDMQAGDIISEADWIQSWTTDNSQHNWALAKINQQVLRITPGNEIAGAHIVKVNENGFSLYKNGQVEFIGRTQNNDTNLYSAAESSDAKSEQRSTPKDAQERYQQVIAALPKQPLPQTWIDQQLMRQAELEKDLTLTEDKMEDKSLVKLNNSKVDDFYSKLGMKPGDVILRVNDDWVHEESNTLFQTLANEQQVTISVMRKGLPVHLAFEVTP